jgi:TonB-linked SusC/RagA family outer membrane protein
MKLTAVFLLGVCLQLSAKANSQTVSIKAKSESLEKVFSDIALQSGYGFFYQDHVLDNVEKVSIEFTNLPISDALQRCLAKTNLSFKIIDKTIIIYNNEEKVKKTLELLQKKAGVLQPELAPGPIKGKITDEYGKPLVGANVVVKGTNIGATTDGSGEFNLAVNGDKSITLVISYVGYENKELETKSGAGINIKLRAVAVQQQDVVVVGYGTQRKATLTGSIVSLGSKDVQSMTSINPLQAIEGKTPGMRIVQSSGQPGSENISMRIRGLNSFVSDNSPLVLINGVVGDITTLDPSFVESITILKDASASIYGARASNGVILVTTKSGTENSKLNVTFNSSYINQSVINMPARIWNSYEYMNLWNTGYDNSGAYLPKYDTATINLYRDPSDKYPSFNWQKFLIKPVNVQNNSLSIGGTNGRTNYNASFGVWNQDGVVQGYFYKKYTGLFGMESKVNDRIKVGLSVNGLVDNTKEPYDGTQDAITSTLAQDPTYKPQLANGSYSFRAWTNEWPQKNALAITREGGQWTNRFLFNGTAYTKWEILNNLVWEVKGGMRSIQTSGTVQTPVVPVFNYITGNSEGYMNGNSTIGLNQSTATDLYYTIYSTLDYKKTWLNVIKSDVLFGLSSEKGSIQSLAGYRYGFASENLDVLNGGPTTGQTNNGSESEYALKSAFGRLNLDYKAKYLFEAQFRRDGSSRFPPNDKYAFFPSFSAGWRLSQEPFIAKNLPLLSDLKIRASYGTLGNDNINGSYYPYQDLLSTNAGYPFSNPSGVSVGNMANNNLKWEQTTIENLGLDFNIKNSMLYGSVEMFKKTTSGILRSLQLPGYAGGGNPYVNMGDVENKGYELVLGHRNHVGKFFYGAEFNLSGYQNKLTKFGAPQYGSTSMLKEGYEINSYYIYQADGIYHSQKEITDGPKYSYQVLPGDVKIVDVNKDGVIDANDRVPVKGVNPKYSFGLNLFGKWNGLDFSVFFLGEEGAKSLVASGSVMPWQNLTCPLAWWLNAWSPSNTKSDIPRVINYYGSNGASTKLNSTYWLMNVSYLRLRNVSIGYTVPLKYTQKIRLDKVRVYFEGQNLLTFTPYKFGDPEAPSTVGYPMFRSLTFGLTAQF